MVENSALVKPWIRRSSEGKEEAVFYNVSSESFLRHSLCGSMKDLLECPAESTVSKGDGTSRPKVRGLLVGIVFAEAQLQVCFSVLTQVGLGSTFVVL